MMAVARLIQTVWQGQQRWSRLAWLLLVPFAFGFSALVRTRNALYDWRTAADKTGYAKGDQRWQPDGWRQR